MDNFYAKVSLLEQFDKSHQLGEIKFHFEPLKAEVYKYINRLVDQLVRITRKDN